MDKALEYNIYVLISEGAARVDIKDGKDDILCIVDIDTISSGLKDAQFIADKLAENIGNCIEEHAYS